MKPEPIRVKSSQLKPNEPMNWYVQAFQQYADFNCRARRSAYWYFVLINTLIVWGIIIIEFVLKTYCILAFLYTIGVIVPAFAVTVR